MHLQFLGKLPLERFAFHAYPRRSMEKRLDTNHTPPGVSCDVFRCIRRAAERPTFGHQRCVQTERSFHSRPPPKKARPEIAGLEKHAMVSEQHARRPALSTQRMRHIIPCSSEDTKV